MKFLIVRRTHERDYFHSIVKATSLSQAAEIFTDELNSSNKIGHQIYCIYPLVTYTIVNGKFQFPEGTGFKVIMPIDITDG